MFDDRWWMLMGAGAYTTALIITLVNLSKKHHETSATLVAVVLGIGFALQSIGLYGRGLAVKGCPVGNPFEVLQFVSWSTMAMYFMAGSIFRMSLLGVFAAGIATILSLLSAAVPTWDYPHPQLFGGNPWIETHAALALFSYGVFALLAATSAMYLLQNYGLKQKQSQGIFAHLPSVYQLDSVNQRLAMVGAGVFSVAMVIGSVHWLGQDLHVTSLKLKITMALWGAYLLLAVLRVLKKLRGKRFAWSAIVLFLLALGTVGIVQSTPEDAASEPVTDPAR